MCWRLARASGAAAAASNEACAGVGGSSPGERGAKGDNGVRPGVWPAAAERRCRRRLSWRSASWEGNRDRATDDRPNARETPLLPMAPGPGMHTDLEAPDVDGQHGQEERDVERKVDDDGDGRKDAKLLKRRDAGDRARTQQEQLGEQGAHHRGARRGQA